MRNELRIKRDLRVLKAYYFIIFAGIGSFLPFVFLHMQELGFSNAQIGVLAALGPATMVFVQSFWGWVTDRTGRPDRVSLLMNLGVALSVTLLLQAKSFPLVVLLIIIYNVFYSSLVPVVDSVVFETIEGTGVGFGELRWFGSLGFALMVLVAGRVSEWTSLTTVMWTYVIFSLGLMILTFRIPVKVRGREAGEPVNLKLLFKNRELMIFLIAAALVIGSNSINYTFFAFLMKDLGGGEGMLGLAMMLAAFAEIPFFLISARLIRKYKIPNMLIIAFGATAIRWYLNSIATSPYHLLAIQLMHSVTFGLLYSSAVVYVDRLVPEKLRASGQTLFWAATYGFGNVVGNLVGGWVYQYSTVQTLFALASIAALAGTLVMVTGVLLPKVRPQP